MRLDHLLSKELLAARHFCLVVHCLVPGRLFPAGRSTGMWNIDLRFLLVVRVSTSLFLGEWKAWMVGGCLEHAVGS